MFITTRKGAIVTLLKAGDIARYSFTAGTVDFYRNDPNLLDGRLKCSLGQRGDDKIFLCPQLQQTIVLRIMEIIAETHNLGVEEYSYTVGSSKDDAYYYVFSKL